MKKIYNFFIKLIVRLIILAFICATAVGVAVLLKPNLLSKVHIYSFDEEKATGIALVENEASLDTKTQMCLVVFIDTDYLEYIGEVTTVTLAIDEHVETYELSDSYSKKAYLLYIDKTTLSIEFATEKNSGDSYKDYTWEPVRKV